MMKCVFTAYGHKNILAEHKKTLEFTKDKDLSPDGDCIIGVRADFKVSELKKLVKYHKHLQMTITVGTLSDSLDFISNSGFVSSRELVIRFSDFVSERTLGVRASKSASMLSRKMLALMKDPLRKMTVVVEPLVKVLLFDFDDTIADYKNAREHVHKAIAEKLFRDHGIYPPSTITLLREVNKDFSIKAAGISQKIYDRRKWFVEFFRRTGIKVSKKYVEDLFKLYWNTNMKYLKPFPYSKSVLRELSKRYILGLITDSDGTPGLKERRMKSTGLLKFFDIIVTGEHILLNKPHPKYYEIVFKKFGVGPSECIMVGDKPQVDLELPHKMGIRTVWMKKGAWSERMRDAEPAYVDYEIEDMRKLLDVVKEI